MIKKRRAKYIQMYCSFCACITKHELIGEPTESERGRFQWAKCVRSRHCQLVNLDLLEEESDMATAVIQVSREDAKRYNPKDEYKIGDIIYHPVWDDIGIVRDKVTLSDGNKAIIVHFANINEKILVENLNNGRYEKEKLTKSLIIN